MATKRQPSKRRTTTRTARVVDCVLRTSRRNGREGDAFHSPETQRQACEQWCKMRGIRIAEVIDETDSVSGKTTKRKGLGRAMSRALKGTTDGIIVARVDRFGRTLVEGMDDVQRLQDGGASFIAAFENIDTGADDKATQGQTKFILGLMFLLAERERDNAIAKWNETRERQIHELGVSNHETFGYRKRASDRILVQVPHEARAVVEMFERRGRGEGWAAIADAINRQGIVTTTGNKWTAQRVRDVIHRRTYLGEVSSGHDYVNHNAHEAIVTQAQWDAAHARAGKRRVGTTGAIDAFMCIGVARCASCGGAMVPNFPGNAQPRYRCRVNFAGYKCAAPASIAQPELDAYVVERLHAEALGKGDVEMSDRTDALDAARVALSAADAALTSWMTDTTLDAMRAEMPEHYQAGTDARMAAVKEAQARVDRESSAAGVVATLPTNLVEVWNAPNTTNDHRRAMLSAYYPVVAVKAGQRKGTDSRKRVHPFAFGDPDLPEGFYTDDGRGHRVSVFHPIETP